MYAIIKHGQVLATGTLEGMFISNIFPLSDTPEWKAAHDVYEVVFPQYNPETQQLVQAAPVISGRTVTLHTVMDRPPPPEPQPPPTSEPESTTIETNTSGADTAI
jgi:hypothetical protein